MNIRGASEGKEVRKVVAPDVIDNYYLIEDKNSSQLVQVTSVSQKGADGEPVKFMARMISKTRFEPVVDPSKPSAKLSEFDWRAAILAILNSRGASTVMSFHELVEDEERYYLIMEHNQDADMINQFLYERDLSEDDIKRLVRQMLTALDSIHKQGFIHRAVDPSNIRFAGPSVEKSELKLLPGVEVVRDDPSSPKHIPDAAAPGGEPGSPGGSGAMAFLAPERLLGEQSAASDLWSVGVFMYIMICAEPPFKSVSADPLRQYAEMKQNPIDWEKQPWPELPAAKNLCQQLLSFEPDLRTPTSRDALAHPWLDEAEADD